MGDKACRTYYLCGSLRVYCMHKYRSMNGRRMGKVCEGSCDACALQIGGPIITPRPRLFRTLALCGARGALTATVVLTC